MLLKTVDRNKAKYKERTIYKLKTMDYVQPTNFNITVHDRQQSLCFGLWSQPSSILF